MTPITRTNWRSHTTEPPLTVRERQQVYAMRDDCRADESLEIAISEATLMEQSVMSAVSAPTEGWQALVTWTDALRQLRRGEVAAWERLT